MFLKQYYIGCLAHASYLVGDEVSGHAAVVDPRRDIQEYLDDASANGLRIEHVILTHFHADFVSGHLDLRDAVGAKIHLGARGDAEYATIPAHDGDIVDLGGVRLELLETPGHTPEGICAVVHDLTKGGQPHAVFTGDTLFIGDVGRPDLVASQGVSPEELAGQLYDSLHEKLLPLPDDTLVYPAHGAGSLCGRNMSTDTSSTMGVQRTFNYALQPMGRDEFIEMAIADLPPAPSYFGWDAQLNRKERPSSRGAISVRRLSLAEVLAAQRDGTQVLDARDPMDFAAAHLRGSINVGLDGAFAQWAGAVLTPGKPIAIVVYPGGEEGAVMRLRRIGFDDVIGFLSGGLQALETRDELVERTERITAPVLAERLASDHPPLIVDVRSPTEWESGHIEGSVNIPLQELPARVGELPADRPLAVHCLGGYRSSVAASLLQHAGLVDFTELVGGFQAWQASKLPTA